MAEISVKRICLKEGKTVYNLFLDRSHSSGILHFTHELDIIFDIVDGKVKLLSAWEIGPGGDQTYDESESDLFSLDHPGLLAEIQQHLDNNEVVWM